MVYNSVMVDITLEAVKTAVEGGMLILGVGKGVSSAVRRAIAEHLAKQIEPLAHEFHQHVEEDRANFRELRELILRRSAGR